MYSGSVHVPVKFQPRGSPIPGMNNLDQGWRSEPVPFNEESARILQNELVMAFRMPNPLFYVFSEVGQTLFGNEGKRFLCALVGYLETPSHLMTLSQLLEGVLHQNYAATLKKIRTATFTRRFGAIPDEDDGLDPYVLDNYRYLKDIGDVFNYKYWFRWQEPEPDDFEYTQIPIIEPGPEVKELWEAALRRVIPNEIGEVKGEEVLLSVSSSSCILDDFSPSKVFKEKGKPERNYFSKETLRGKRAPVYKGPTEVRDCIILPVPQSNTVKWIEKQCAVIAKDTLYSAYGKDPEEFRKLLKDFYEEGAWYYNRDLTKEGLTKPRWMLRSMAKVFKERWPHMPIWDYFSIYNHLEFFDKGKLRGTFRGHGLGTANALTTIMQCATFSFSRETGDIADLDGIDALFYNDDATIKTRDSVDVLTYSLAEQSQITELGLLPKTSKTYASPVMVLCERYFPENISTKASYGAYIRRLPFSATNVVTAKSMVHLVDDPAFGPLEPMLLRDLMAFWGPEWSPKEFELPWWAGGWLKPTYKGVDLSFFLEDIDPSLLGKGWAVGAPQLKPNFFKGGSGGIWNHPIFQVQSSLNLEKLDKEVWKDFDIGQPVKVIASKFHRNQNDHEVYSWFKKILIDRYKASVSPQKPCTMVDLYSDVIEKHRTIDFIPPSSLRCERPLEKFAFPKDGGVRPRPPNQPNKLLGSLCWFSGYAYIHGVIPYPYIPGVQDEVAIPPERLSKYQESVFALPGVSVIDAPDETYTCGFAFKERNYINDYNVMEAWVWATGNEDTYPLPVVLSPWAKYMKKGEQILFAYDAQGFPELWDIWVRETRDLAVFFLHSVFTQEEWDDIFNSVKLELAEESALRDSDSETEDQGKTIAPDFWTWKGNQDIYDAPRELLWLWREAERLVRNSQLYTSLKALDTDRKIDERISDGVPPAGSMMDRWLQNLAQLVRTETDGHAHYTMPTSSLWDDSSESGTSQQSAGGAMFGLFGD
jgi:hypothetical protein